MSDGFGLVVWTGGRKKKRYSVHTHRAPQTKGQSQPDSCVGTAGVMAAPVTCCFASSTQRQQAQERSERVSVQNLAHTIHLMVCLD